MLQWYQRQVPARYRVVFMGLDQIEGQGRDQKGPDTDGYGNFGHWIFQVIFIGTLDLILWFR